MKTRRFEFGTEDRRPARSEAVRTVRLFSGMLSLCLVASVAGCVSVPDDDGSEEKQVIYRNEARALGARESGEKFDAVARFYELGEEGIPTLVAHLDDPDPEVRIRAARILVDFGDDRGVPALLDGLGAESDEVRNEAIRGLIVHSRRSLDGVVSRLDHEDPRVRGGALIVLRACGARGTLARVVPVLNDPAPSVRREAVLTVGEIMIPGAPPLQLVDRLVDPDIEVRRATVHVFRVRAGYVGTIPEADQLEDLEDVVGSVRLWAATQRRVRGVSD